MTIVSTQIMLLPCGLMVKKMTPAMRQKIKRYKRAQNHKILKDPSASCQSSSRKEETVEQRQQTKSLTVENDSFSGIAIGRSDITNSRSEITESRCRNTSICTKERSAIA